MGDRPEVVQYIRKNRKETAVVYVRGNNEELQEMVCRIYAIDQGYKVLYTTTHLEDVNGCDYLLVTNLSRISRNQTEYYKALNKLKKKGITVVSVTSQDNADESITLAMDMFRTSKARLDKKEG